LNGQTGPDCSITQPPGGTFCQTTKLPVGVVNESHIPGMTVGGRFCLALVLGLAFAFTCALDFVFVFAFAFTFAFTFALGFAFAFTFPFVFAFFFAFPFAILVLLSEFAVTGASAADRLLKNQGSFLAMFAGNLRMRRLHQLLVAGRVGEVVELMQAANPVRREACLHGLGQPFYR